jgi:hypothetical protein
MPGQMKENCMSGIENIPGEVWAAFGGAFIALISTITAALITNRYSFKQLEAKQNFEFRVQEQKRIRERKEELYIQLQKFLKFMFIDHTFYIRVAKNELKVEQAMDLTLKSSQDVAFDADNIMMLIDFYFPSVRNGLEDLMELNGKLDSFRHKVKETAISEKSFDKDFVDRYAKLLIKLTQEQKKFKDQIREELANRSEAALA